MDFDVNMYESKDRIKKKKRGGNDATKDDERKQQRAINETNK